MSRKGAKCNFSRFGSMLQVETDVIRENGYRDASTSS